MRAFIHVVFVDRVYMKEDLSLHAQFVHYTRTELSRFMAMLLKIVHVHDINSDGGIIV